eukprot:scaffold82230_cov73-Phaeocystis_antarctica.AAC.2
MAQRRLVDHVDVVRRRLIVHAPAAVDKLQLPRPHEPPRERLDLRCLLRPPTLEEGLFRVDELALGVLGQRADHRVEDVPNARVLDAVVLPSVVLIDRLQPADVVMCVRDDVHVEDPLSGCGVSVVANGRGHGETDG